MCYLCNIILNLQCLAFILGSNLLFVCVTLGYLLRCCFVQGSERFLWLLWFKGPVYQLNTKSVVLTTGVHRFLFLSFLSVCNIWCCLRWLSKTISRVTKRSLIVALSITLHWNPKIFYDAIVLHNICHFVITLHFLMFSRNDSLTVKWILHFIAFLISFSQLKGSISLKLGA